MSPPSSLTVLRAAGFVSWAMIGLETFLREQPSPPAGAPAWGPWLVLSVSLGAFLAFGAAFGWNTRRIQGRAPTRASVLLLVLQIVLSLLVSTDLLLLVAVEAPLILSGRAAALWLAVQALASVALGLQAASSGGFDPLPGLAHFPRGVVVALSILSLVVWEALAFAVGYLAATQYRDAEALERSHRELGRVNAELLATQALLADSSRLAERLRISRELHDAVGHHLAALSLHLELARLHVDGAATEPVAEARAVAKQLLHDVREMVSTLRQDRALDLRRALETLVAGTREPLVHLAMPLDLDAAAPAQAHAIFRCAQEALTNVIRHADARNVWIDVTRDAQRLEIRVRDDGRGVAEVRSANGLDGMRERFEESSGGLEIESSPGDGFRLRAWLPLPEEQA